MQFFEMHNLYIMWLYALRIAASKVSVDAFVLLYSKLLHAKLSLFVFDALFAELHWHVIKVTDWDHTCSRVFANLRPISTFFKFHLIELLFGRVLASVCEAQLRLCVDYSKKNILLNFRLWHGNIRHTRVLCKKKLQHLISIN